MSRIGVAIAIITSLLVIGCGTPQQAESTLETPLPSPLPLSYVQREGKTLYSHYCAPCHGDEGMGDGFNAYNLDPKPRNFNDTEFQSSRGDEDLARVIRIGGGAASLSAGMPPWGNTLNDREIGYVLQYLRVLGRKDTMVTLEP